RALPRRKIAVGFGGVADRLERRSQRFATLANDVHIRRGTLRRAGEALSAFFEYDSPAHLIVERPHGPIEPAQGFGTRNRVVGEKRIVGIVALEVIDERPQPADAGTVEVDE